MWKDSAGREQCMPVKELSDWRGNRAYAGRLAHGLPKSNKFNRGVERSPPHAAGCTAADTTPSTAAGFMASTIAVGIRIVAPRSLVVS
jgi:hypothetical protein